MTKEEEIIEYNKNPNLCRYCGKPILYDGKYKLSYIKKRFFCNKNCYINYCNSLNKKIGIYQIKNIINNKLYIGQSVDIEQRWRSHKWELENNCHSNKHLQLSWNKYGKENFEFDILCECDSSELDYHEKKYIKLFNTTNSNFGYNFEFGGNLNKKQTEETRKKISKNHADVSKENNPFFGKKHSSESIEKFKNNPNYINRRHKGEESHKCTITENTAREIKKYFSDGHKIYKGEITDVAKKYNVSKMIVSHIKNGHAWAWLEV